MVFSDSEFEWFGGALLYSSILLAVTYFDDYDIYINE